MANTAQVLVLSGDPAVTGFAKNLREIGIDAASASAYSDALRLSERMPAGYISVLDGDLPPDVFAQMDTLVHGSGSGPVLVLLAPTTYERFASSPERQALDEYVAKPVRPEELTFRVKAMMLRAGYDVPGGSNNWGDVRLDADGMRHGVAVAVFAGKGGVGKTTVAINLAVGLAALHQKKVLLIDTDLWFGDAGVLLNMYSSKSLFDVASGGELSLERLQNALVTHESGVSLLLRPPDLATAEKVDTIAVSKAISEYKALFDYIIVDTHPSFHDLNLQILDAVDRILVLCTPDISTTHNTAQFLEVAKVLDCGQKVTLVLNRANSGVSTEAMASSLGLPISATIVSAGRAVVDAATQGMTMFAKDPDQKEQITRDLAHLVDLVAGRTTTSAMGGGKSGSRKPPALPAAAH